MIEITITLTLCRSFRQWIRIPTVKLKDHGKSIFEIRNQNFCYIQVIVFDLSYLPMAAVTEVLVSDFNNAFPGIFHFTVGIAKRTLRLEQTRFLAILNLEFIKNTENSCKTRILSSF